MAKICIVTTLHPAANPRGTRDADALAQAGHEVVFAYPRCHAQWLKFDEPLLRAAPWRAVAVDCLGAGAAAWRWRWGRLRRRLWTQPEVLARSKFGMARAAHYVGPELAVLAQAERADLYLAHSHNALPAAHRAARNTGARLGFDAEDLLVDSPEEPVALMDAIERRCLPACSQVSTMSEAAAERLQETRQLLRLPVVLHNVPSLRERQGLRPPEERPMPKLPALYWVGKTIGPHSLADQVVAAMPRVRTPFRLVLRGSQRADYAERLAVLAALGNVADRIEFLPPAPPTELVATAGECELCLGSQPGMDLFHQMAIGNKVFLGMMAGAALILSDTIAHRALLRDAPGAGLIFRDGNLAELAGALDAALAPARLAELRHRSWELGETRFNWDLESRRLVDAVARTLAAPRPEF